MAAADPRRRARRTLSRYSREASNTTTPLASDASVSLRRPNRSATTAPLLGLEVRHVDRHGGREEQELVVPAAGIKLALRNLAPKSRGIHVEGRYIENHINADL